MESGTDAAVVSWTEPGVLPGLESRMETGEEARDESETKAATEAWPVTWVLPGFEASMDNGVGVAVGPAM